MTRPGSALSSPPALLGKLAPGKGAALGAALWECAGAGAVWAYQQAGLDWLWLDTEHTPNGETTIRAVAEATWPLGMPLLVRVPDGRTAPLSRPLDFGANGIIVPRVESAVVAEQAVRACLFPPRGVRGFGLAQRFCPDPHLPVLRQLAEINRRTIVVVQVETAPALDQVEEIAAVPGLDAILFGPADMSISLGVDGQTEHPQMLEAMERVARACAAAGIAAGYHHEDAAAVGRAAQMGYTLLSVGCDTTHLFRGTHAAAGVVAAACRAGANTRR